MASCCPPEAPKPVEPENCCSGESAALTEAVVVGSSCCDTDDLVAKRRFDWLLWGTLVLVSIAYLIDLSGLPISGALADMTSAVRSLMDSMWIGLALGMFFVGVLGRVPREFVSGVLGRGDSAGGIVRATFAGVLLDLCSHGILLVAMRLYQRGASLGQVMAFLIASPWNSLSLTVILIALIGWQWTLLFVVCSMFIGIVSGLIFNLLVRTGRLPENPNIVDMDGFKFWPEATSRWQAARFDLTWWRGMLWEGLKDSRMIVRWLLLGVLLAAAIRTFVSIDHFQTYFGATLIGLGMTLVVATILEICSEGSTPIAADLLTRAQAPGNSFAFLMTGVATDYTEIMSLKETTKSWKISLFLPLITVPQVIVFAWVMNISGG